VIFTALASWSMPRSRDRRASSSKAMSLGAIPSPPPVRSVRSSAPGHMPRRRSQPWLPTASTHSP
jgi:hypothetical protein